MVSQSVRILAENRKGSVQIFAEINGGIAILIWLNEKQIMSAFVNTVGRLSFPMEIAIVNTAVTDAM